MLITNCRFADNIVVNAEEDEEADVLVDRLDTTTTRYTTEIGPDKTKVIPNNPNAFQTAITIKRLTARSCGELQGPEWRIQEIL